MQKKVEGLLKQQEENTKSIFVLFVFLYFRMIEISVHKHGGTTMTNLVCS